MRTLARRQFRRPQALFLAGIGLMAGMTYASISSMQRFAGLEQNDGEVARYGALTVGQLKAKEDHLNYPNVGLIDDRANE
jgi:hypothetical protein